MGEMNFDAFNKEILGVDQGHSWSLNIVAGTIITISAAAGLDLDLTITVLDPAGQPVVSQNEADPGEVEIVASLPINTDGLYQIIFNEATGRETDYAFMVINQESYPFIFAGIVAYGEAWPAALDEESDHFWFFYGEAGDVISFELTPAGDGDLFYDLYAPDTVSLFEFVDEGGAGDPETLFNYTLPTTGLYTIRLGEFNFAAAIYTVTLTKG